MTTSTPAQQKRVRVKANEHNQWAFTCPLCGKGFSNNLLNEHVDDHRYGRWGYQQADVQVEVTMLIPPNPQETP